MGTHAIRRLILLAASALALLAPAPAGATAAGGPLSWSASKLIDGQPPFGQGFKLLGMSCPSSSLCVAVDDSGHVLTSTDRTGGASAWAVTRVDGFNFISDVSCVPGLCVAVDAAGHVLTSTDPTGGAGAWSLHPGPTTTQATVRCWRASRVRRRRCAWSLMATATCSVRPTLPAVRGPPCSSRTAASTRSPVTPRRSA